MSAYDDLKGLITSPEWKLYVKLLETHKEFLRNQVVVYVGQSDFNSAMKYKARIDECDSFINIMKNELARLNQNGREG